MPRHAATTGSLSRAFEVVKEMPADGLDRGEGCRPVGRQALAGIIEGRMAEAVDRWLDTLDAGASKLTVPRRREECDAARTTRGTRPRSPSPSQGEGSGARRAQGRSGGLSRPRTPGPRPGQRRDDRNTHQESRGTRVDARVINPSRQSAGDINPTTHKGLDSAKRRWRSRPACSGTVSARSASVTSFC